MLQFKNSCMAVVTTGFTMQQYNSPAMNFMVQMAQYKCWEMIGSQRLMSMG